MDKDGMVYVRQCKKLEEENKRQAERIEQLEDVLTKIQNWSKAYPLKVFPEPDFEKAAKVLKEAGITLDAISASNMRHVINRVNEMIEQVLKTSPQSESEKKIS